MDNLKAARKIVDINWTKEQKKFLSEVFNKLDLLRNSCIEEKNIQKLSIINKAYDEIYVTAVAIAIKEMRESEVAME